MYIRELRQCDSLAMCNYISFTRHFLKPHLHPVTLICILWAQFAHYKSLILSNCCCHRGWTGDALPLAPALSKHSLSEDGCFTYSIFTVLFCLTSSPSHPFWWPRHQGSVASFPETVRLKTWNLNMQQSQDWRLCANGSGDSQFYSWSPEEQPCS